MTPVLVRRCHSRGTAWRLLGRFCPAMSTSCQKSTLTLESPQCVNRDASGRPVIDQHSVWLRRRTRPRILCPARPVRLAPIHRLGTVYLGLSAAIAYGRSACRAS